VKLDALTVLNVDLEVRSEIVALVALAACSTSPDHVVATLEAAVASVERMPRAEAAWQVARKGDTFVNGSAVRTGRRVAREAARRQVGPARRATELDRYFTRDGRKQRDDVKVETGGVEIEAGEASLGLGKRSSSRDRRCAFDSAADGTTIVVTFGRVVLEDNVIEAGRASRCRRARGPP